MRATARAGFDFQMSADQGAALIHACQAKMFILHQTAQIERSAVVKPGPVIFDMYFNQARVDFPADDNLVGAAGANRVATGLLDDAVQVQLDCIRKTLGAGR